MSGANMTAAVARVQITVQIADGRFVRLEMNESTARFLAERLVAHADAIELAARMEAP